MRSTATTRVRRVLAASLFCLPYLAGLPTARVSADDTVPLPLRLPKAAMEGTPADPPEGCEDVEPYTEKRALPQVPKDIRQLALRRPVTNGPKPVSEGSLEWVTDGKKEVGEQTVVLLAPRTQWVQIDLGAAHTLYDIVFWHYHGKHSVFHDVIVQVSNDAEFKSGVTTLFNNDKDNTSGLGAGSDREYWDSFMGKLVNAKASKARYVRLYSRGSTLDDPLNRYTEVEVWGL